MIQTRNGFVPALLLTWLLLGPAPRALAQDTTPSPTPAAGDSTAARPRVTSTFRYVPDEHVTAFADLPVDARDDIRGYVATLAESSAYFAAALAAER